MASAARAVAAVQATATGKRSGWLLVSSGGGWQVSAQPWVLMSDRCYLSQASPPRPCCVLAKSRFCSWRLRETQSCPLVMYRDLRRLSSSRCIPLYCVFLYCCISLFDLGAAQPK